MTVSAWGRQRGRRGGVLKVRGGAPEDPSNELALPAREGTWFAQLVVVARRRPAVPGAGVGPDDSRARILDVRPRTLRAAVEQPAASWFGDLQVATEPLS
jgi:hypothetical protein